MTMTLAQAGKIVNNGAMNPILRAQANQVIQNAMAAGKAAKAAAAAPAASAPSAAASTPAVQGATTSSAASKIVAGTPGSATDMNVADYSGELALDPTKGIRKDNPATAANESGFMQDHTKGIDENATGTNINGADPKYNQQDTTAHQAETAAQVDPRTAAEYDVKKTADDVAAQDMEGAQGQVSDDTIIDPNEVPQIDMQGTATGLNTDGTINWTGMALNDFAKLGLDDVDERATAKGQLAMLQEDFTGPNGEPKIPNWAQGSARAVARMGAFKGLTGTAATAAMATALMEASLPIAQADASFYQTLTLQNLSNEQAMTINKANVLAKMDLTNADNRMAAVIQNSQAFLQMDMKNLDNEQQAKVINTQNRVQAILEDGKQENAKRLFVAQSQNEMGMFYDNLNSSIQQFNANQNNQMTQFDAELENNKQQFYKNMQFQIDTSNAKWRQTVTLTESQQAFDAAAMDVKNMADISSEALAQLWDRSDSLLDYVWKSSENAKDRAAAITMAQLKAKLEGENADKEGMGKLFGSIAGAGADALFSAIF